MSRQGEPWETRDKVNKSFFTRCPGLFGLFAPLRRIRFRRVCHLTLPYKNFNSRSDCNGDISHHFIVRSNGAWAFNLRSVCRILNYTFLKVLIMGNQDMVGNFLLIILNKRIFY